MPELQLSSASSLENNKNKNDMPDDQDRRSSRDIESGVLRRSIRNDGAGPSDPTQLRRSVALRSSQLQRPFSLVGSLSDPSVRMHLCWLDLHYHVFQATSLWQRIFRRKQRPRKDILRGVDGEALPGQVIAIMGASGAGKTTLLNLLAGRVDTGEIEGSIVVNGQRRKSNWKKVAAYVQQEDVMYHMLTVRETVGFAADLKLPRRMPKAERKARVEYCLQSLGLGHIADSKLGDALHRGISGGERKRVSIAVELVSDPRLVFLDEPTSGLDAFTAFYIVENIKEVASEEWRTVLMTIHQPRSNILRLFDKILLLSQGKVVFFGHVDEALEHFARCGYDCPRHENPADFFLDIISVDTRTPNAERTTAARADKLIAAWAATHPSVGNVDPVDHGRAAKQHNRWNHLWITEFAYLFRRDMQTQFRDVATVVGLCVQTLIIGLLISFIFFQMPLTFAGVQNRIGLLFFVPINQTFLIVMPLIPIFALDRAIIVRERYSAMYRVSASFASKFLSLVPLRVLLTTIFCFIVYYITGLRSGFQYFLIFWCLLVVHTLCSIALGMFVAASVPSVQVGQVVGPLLIVIFLLFGGNLANAGSVTWILRWIQYTSLIFYCYQGLISSQLDGLTFEGVPGQFYLNLYDLDQFSWYAATGALLGLTGVFLLLGYIALRISTRPKMKLA